jgi:hypothetical protein
MKLSINLGRWTTLRAGLAIASALAIGGAVGSAIAISPKMDAPVRWAAGVEFHTAIGVNNGLLYEIPAGKNFMLTDLIVSNETENWTAFRIFSKPNRQRGCGIFDEVEQRSVEIIVPAHDNTILAFQTGIGFKPGHLICVLGDAYLNFTGRGFLFTPS